MNKSKERAMEILRRHLKRVEDWGADRVLSVILVGSLSNGSYTADAGSDIDLVHILRDDAPAESRQAILNLIRQTEAQTNGDIPISKCVYRYRELFRPYPADFALCLENKDYIDLPIEIMRIKDSGQTVWGEHIIGRLSYPLREDVYAHEKLMEQWEKQEEQNGFQPIPYDVRPMRLIVQSVLVRALLDYFFATGKSCSCKAQVAAKLRQDVPDYRFLELVDCCTKWRYRPGDFTESDKAVILKLWKQWVISRENQDVDYVPMI